MREKQLETTDKNKTWEEFCCEEKWCISREKYSIRHICFVDILSGINNNVL